MKRVRRLLYCGLLAILGVVALGTGASHATDPLPVLPTVYYGSVGAALQDVPPEDIFVPVEGMEVQAWIEDRTCGYGEVFRGCQGRMEYAAYVSADDGGTWSGCGQEGREIVFYVDERKMLPTAVWEDGQVVGVELNLLPTVPAEWMPKWRAYLPVVGKGAVHG